MSKDDDDEDGVRDGREDRAPKRMGSKTVAGIVMSAEQVTTMMLDQEDILEKVSALFDIYNNPKPTAAQMAVTYVMADRVKMAIVFSSTTALILGLAAFFTGSLFSWDKDGSFQIGSSGDGSSMGDTVLPDE